MREGRRGRDAESPDITVTSMEWLEVHLLNLYIQKKKNLLSTSQQWADVFPHVKFNHQGLSNVSVHNNAILELTLPLTLVPSKFAVP